MRPEINYNYTYVSFATWEYIVIILATVLYNSWKIMQLYHMLDFTQYTVERECFMNTPKDISLQIDIMCLLQSKETSTVSVR